MRRTRAFTLVEVLVVIAIIGIASAVVVPQMLKSGTLTVQAASRMIIADLLYAQNEAIAQQATRRLVFDASDNRYELTDASGNVLSVTWKNGGDANYYVDFDEDSRFAGVTIDSAAFGDEAFVEFDDLGAPIEGGSIELVGAGHRYLVSVAPFTGRVTVEPVTEEE